MCASVTKEMRLYIRYDSVHFCCQFMIFELSVEESQKKKL